MNGSPEFWAYLDQLVATSEVIIDRPKGTAHPNFPEMVYPLDYGHLRGTSASDGNEIDVWRGGKALPSLDMIALTADQLKCEVEIKLLLGCCEEDQAVIREFLQSNNLKVLMVRRDQQEILRQRRSIRHFRSTPVPREIVERVLLSAASAPSAHNRQPWRFAVVESQSAKESLARAMGADHRRDLYSDGLSDSEVERQVQRSIRRITSAPLMVIVCMAAGEMIQYPDERRQGFEYILAVQSVAMAGENLLLAAHLEGLGGVWMCAPLFAPEAATRSLELPPDWQPQGLVLLGYPAVTPADRQRKAIKKLARYY